MLGSKTDYQTHFWDNPSLDNVSGMIAANLDLDIKSFHDKVTL